VKGNVVGCMLQCFHEVLAIWGHLHYLQASGLEWQPRDLHHAERMHETQLLAAAANRCHSRPGAKNLRHSIISAPLVQCQRCCSLSRTQFSP
jgi:hypothetical protein